MNTNFGFSFGVPVKKEEEAEGEGSFSQPQTQDFSIDLDQITPPTFRFGQFGQAPLPNEPKTETDGIAAATGSNESSADHDSFLAEPSISVGQFDASFNFAASSESLEASAAPPQKSPTSSASASIPTLVEEPLPEPDYLEEPAPHSVEDLFKATVDGSAADIVLDDSWENVGIEEIEAAQAEFDSMKQQEIEKIEKAEAIEHVNILISEDSKVVEAVESPAAVEAVETVESPTETVEAHTKAKATPKKTPPAKKEPKIDTSVILSEGRSKRQRKTVERLAEETAVAPKTSKAIVEKSSSVPKGHGSKLGDIEIIEKNLSKKLASDKHISTLHRIIYDRVGEARTRKSNLRSFCGLEDPEDTTRLEGKLQKMTAADLKALASLLGLPAASEKSALVTRIAKFLAKPNPEEVKAEKAAAPVKKTSKASKVIKTPKAKAITGTKRAATTTKKSPTATNNNKKTKVLTPEIVDSDVESEIEREVLSELNDNNEE